MLEKPKGKKKQVDVDQVEKLAQQVGAKFDYEEKKKLEIKGNRKNYPLKLEWELFERLEKYAKDQGRSINSMINRFIEIGIREETK